MERKVMESTPYVIGDRPTFTITGTDIKTESIDSTDPYIIYIIHVVHGKFEYDIGRRYKSFYHFRNQIIHSLKADQNFGNLSKNLPKFPTKSLFGLSSEVVVNRKNALNNFLHSVRDIAWVNTQVNKILGCFLSKDFGFKEDMDLYYLSELDEIFSFDHIIESNTVFFDMNNESPTLYKGKPIAENLSLPPSIRLSVKNLPNMFQNIISSPKLSNKESPFRPSFSQPLMSSIFKEGFMMKKGGWKGGRQSKDVLLGIVLLDEGILKEEKNTELESKKDWFNFSILTTERQIFLATEKEKDGRIWMEAIKECIKKIPLTNIDLKVAKTESKLHHDYVNEFESLHEFSEPNSAATSPTSRENEMDTPKSNQITLFESSEFLESKPLSNRSKTSRNEKNSEKGLLDQWELNYEDLEVCQKVAEGAFGEVFFGKYQGTNVAIKKLIQTNVTDELIQNLKTEIAILSQLRHPNIVLYIGAVTQLPNVCIVTEWCGRGSLFDCLHDQDLLINGKMMIQISLEIARGMAYLHSRRKSIIHRDLKSHNILVTDDFGIKVADFGLTVIRESNARGTTSEDKGKHTPVGEKIKQEVKMRISLLRKSRSFGNLIDNKEDIRSGGHYGIRGTPQWMPYEVFEGLKYNEKVDIYSYGIILSEIFTRKMPYEDRFKGFDFIEAVVEDGIESFFSIEILEMKRAMPSIPLFLFGKKSNIKTLANKQDTESLEKVRKISELITKCLGRDPRKRPEFLAIIDVLNPVFQLEDQEMLYCFDLPRMLLDLDSQDPSTKYTALLEVSEFCRKLMYPCHNCISRDRKKPLLNSSHIILLMHEIVGSLIVAISVLSVADTRNMSSEKDQKNALVACSKIRGTACKALLWCIKLEESENNLGEICSLLEEHCIDTLIQLSIYAEILIDDDRENRLTLYKFNPEAIIMNDEEDHALTLILQKVHSYNERKEIEVNTAKIIQDKVGEHRRSKTRKHFVETPKNRLTEHDDLLANKLIAQIDLLKTSLSIRLNELKEL